MSDPVAGTGPAAGTNAAHILIAEDDAPSAAVVRTVLTRAGYCVSSVKDGPSALRFLEEHGPPDILLLDWMLPGISGLEVCHRVRERWDTLALPILMVTAKTDAESISAAFDAGASDYITKPYLGAELRARIAAHLRTKALIEERQQMEEHLREREKLSALGLLVGSVAHDLNNPLSGISGYAQLLLMGETEAQREKDLKQILSEVERCRAIVGNLLGFARRQPPERSSTEIGPILRSIFDLRERHLRNAGIQANLTVCGYLPAVFAVGHQLQQVFLNILLNAEQAMRPRGGILHVAAGRAAAPGSDAAPDSETLLTDGDGEVDWVAIEFFNNGPCIPPEVLPHIFEPLFTTKAEDEGTGLGLSICQRIVREHGGEISVKSDDEGTTFRVLLPVELAG